MLSGHRADDAMRRFQHIRFDGLAGRRTKHARSHNVQPFL